MLTSVTSDNHCILQCWTKNQVHFTSGWGCKFKEKKDTFCNNIIYKDGMGALPPFFTISIINCTLAPVDKKEPQHFKLRSI